MEPNLLYANMHYLLDRVVEQALLADFTLPTRQYVTLGGAVFDCEQVSVSAINSDPGLVSSDPGAINLLGNCDVPWNTNYEVAIVLCAVERVIGQRGESPPPVEKVDADALQISAAYAVLRDVVDVIVASGDLGTPSASIAFSQPQGGLIAVVLSFNSNVWVNPPEVP